MSPTGSFRRLVRILLARPWLPLAAAASLGLLSSAQLGLTWVVRRWADGPILAGRGAETRPLLLAAAVLVVAMAFLLTVSRTLLARLSQELLRSLRDRASEALLAARLPALRRHASGDLVSRVFQDAGLLSGFAETLIRRLAGDAVLAAGALAAMFVLDARLALVTLLLVPFVAVVLGGAGEAIRRRGRKAQEAAGDLQATLSEQVRGLTTIRGLLAERTEAARFAAGSARAAREAVRAEAGISLLVGAVFLAAAAGFVAAVAVGSHAVASGRMTSGALLAFCLFGGQTVEPLRRLAEVHGMLQRALGAADRLFDLVDLPPEEETVRAGTPRVSSGALRIEALRFRHEPSEPLLEGIDLELSDGERLAVAAPSGAGKSTLARLLVRLETPQGGRVLLGGADLADLPRADARRAVLVLPQEPFVFGGTLAENLALGSAAPRASIEEAALRAGLGPLLSALPGGLGARVGDAGRSLSGGERQRVSLARALLRDPRLVVLDEATSALDGDAEDALFAAIGPWLASRSVLLLAHRLGTLRRAPRVAVLSGGRVVFDGSPDDTGAGSLLLGVVGSQAAPPGASPAGPG